MMRKNLCRLIALPCLCSLIVIGCSSTKPSKTTDNSSKNSEKSSDGTVSLRVWGGKEDQDLLQEIADSFQQEHSDVKFEFTFEPMSESECKDALLDNINEAPDVFTFADDQLMALAASGMLRPIEEPDAIAKQNIEAAVDAASIGETLYAYPLTADNGYFLFYDKSVFNENDIKTFDGLLKKAESKKKKITMDWSSGWYTYAFFGNTGLTLTLNDDGLTNTCNWNATDQKINGIDVANAMLDISSSPSFLSGADEPLLEGAKKGTVAAGVSGVWAANSLAEVWGSHLGASKLPTYTINKKQVQMASYAGYKLVGVNSFSENSDWASQFAEWMSNEQNQTLRFEQRGQGPSNIKAAASKDVEKSPAIQALLAQSEFSSLQRVGGAFWKPTTVFGNNMAKGKKKDLQKQLDVMVKGITALPSD